MYEIYFSQAIFGSQSIENWLKIEFDEFPNNQHPCNFPRKESSFTNSIKSISLSQQALMINGFIDFKIKMKILTSYDLSAPSNFS